MTTIAPNYPNPDPASGVALYSYLRIDTVIETSRIFLPIHPDEMKRHIEIFLTENMDDYAILDSLKITHWSAEVYIAQYSINGKAGSIIFAQTWDTLNLEASLP